MESKKYCRKSFKVIKKGLDNTETRPRLDSGTPDYNQESAKKWVSLRSLFGKCFLGLANVLRQFLWRAKFLRDNSSSCTSIYKVNKINVGALESLLIS